MEKESDIKSLIEKQLEACGVEYFDYLLMHVQNKTLHEKYMKNNDTIKLFGLWFREYSK